MKAIDRYVNDIYREISGHSKEINDSKEEIKQLLSDNAKDWMAEGKTEEEAVELAIQSFGNRNKFIEELSEVYRTEIKFAKNILVVAMIALAICIVTMTSQLYYSSNSFSYLSAPQRDYDFA